MLHYIITNAVLFSFVLTNENIPSALADWILAQKLGWFGFLLLDQCAPADRRQFHGAELDHLDHGPDPRASRETIRHRSGAFRHRQRNSNDARRTFERLRRTSNTA